MTKEWFGQKELMDLLIYNKETGLFTWKIRCGRQGAGTSAGWLDKHGYINIGLFKLNHAAHRLAWLYVYGEWPKGQVDHKNMIVIDNRIENLRVASMTSQRANQKVRKDSLSGFKGVQGPTKYGRYCARIRKHGLTYRLGWFSTPEEANAAYAKKAKELFGEFARTS